MVLAIESERKKGYEELVSFYLVYLASKSSMTIRHWRIGRNWLFINNSHTSVFVLCKLLIHYFYPFIAWEWYQSCILYNYVGSYLKVNFVFIKYTYNL